MKIVYTMDDEELLREFMYNSMHAGDEFAISPYEDEDAVKGRVLKEEILRRMRG